MYRAIGRLRAGESYRVAAPLVSCTGRASVHGPGQPAAHGPGQDSIIFCGPGAGGPETCRPGLISNSFAGCGPGLTFPGLGLTFPGLGRAGPGPNFPGPGSGRAYSESHSCVNIMVKDYLPSSIHCNKIIVF